MDLSVQAKDKAQLMKECNDNYISCQRDGVTLHPLHAYLLLLIETHSTWSGFSILFLLYHIKSITNTITVAERTLSHLVYIVLLNRF
jgi:hypothetical protein